MEKEKPVKEPIMTKITNAGFLEQHNFLTSKGFKGAYSNYKILKHFEGDKDKALQELTEKKKLFLEKLAKQAEEEGLAEPFKKLAEQAEFKPNYVLNALRKTKGDEQSAVEFIKAKELKKAEKKQKKAELKESFKTQLEFLHSKGAVSDKKNIKVLEIYKGDLEKSLAHLQGRKAHSHKNIEEVYVAEGLEKQLQALKDNGVHKLKQALNLLRKNGGNIEETMQVLQKKTEKVEKKKEKVIKKEHKKEQKKKFQAEKKSFEEISKEKGYHEQYNNLRGLGKYKEKYIAKALEKTAGDPAKAQEILDERQSKKGFHRIKTLKEFPAGMKAVYLDATNTFYSDKDIKSFLFRRGDFKVAEEALIELTVSLASATSVRSVSLFFENRNQSEERQIKLASGDLLALHLCENKIENETIFAFAQSLKPEQLSEGLFVTPDKILGSKILGLSAPLMKPSAFLNLLKGVLEKGRFESLFQVK